MCERIRYALQRNGRKRLADKFSTALRKEQIEIFFALKAAGVIDVDTVDFSKRRIAW